MLTNLDLHKILFLDIETVPLYNSFSAVPPEEQYFFEEKTAYQRKEEQTAEEFYGKAGIWAEFGKIVCILALNIICFVVTMPKNLTFPISPDECL